MKQENIAFLLRMIHNQIRLIIHKSAPKFEKAPKTQLQGGIMGYLYHNQDQAVYQRDVEREFHISRATATNTLQVMEREGFLVRRALDKDGRLKRIQLTEEACLNHRQVEQHMELMDRRMLRGLSEEEAEELRRLLRVLHNNLEEMEEELSEKGNQEGSSENLCRKMEYPEEGK